jgi:hypothetical protein
MTTRKKLRLVGVGESGRVVGEWHHNAKLSDAEVDLLRELREIEGWSWTRLATTFGISRAGVRSIGNYRCRAQAPVRFKKVKGT